MEIKEALKIIQVASGSYKGTRAEHQQIVQAMQVIQQCVVEKEAQSDKKEDEEE